jgi:hypothetical protein
VRRTAPSCALATAIPLRSTSTAIMAQPPRVGCAAWGRRRPTCPVATKVASALRLSPWLSLAPRPQPSSARGQPVPTAWAIRSRSPWSGPHSITAMSLVSRTLGTSTSVSRVSLRFRIGHRCRRARAATADGRSPRRSPAALYVSHSEGGTVRDSLFVPAILTTPPKGRVRAGSDRAGSGVGHCGRSFTAQPSATLVWGSGHCFVNKEERHRGVFVKGRA